MGGSGAVHFFVLVGLGVEALLLWIYVVTETSCRCLRIFWRPLTSLKGGLIFLCVILKDGPWWAMLVPCLGVEF